MKKLFRHNTVSAFTLNELLVVILIVVAIAGFALPNFMFAVERIRAQQQAQNLLTVFHAQKIHLKEEGVYAQPGLAASLELADYVQIMNNSDFTPIVTGCGSDASKCPFGAGTVWPCMGSKGYLGYAIRLGVPANNQYFLFVFEDGTLGCKTLVSAQCTGYCERLGFEPW